MPSHSFPFAVRLIGFPTAEADAFEATFAVEHGKGYGYFRLSEDNLRDPDIYIANADHPQALVTLSELRPSEVRPALLIGRIPAADLPYPRIAKPIEWHTLFQALDALVEKRADILSRLEASDIVTVPERRRRDRLDTGLADPSEYECMRVGLPTNGTLLVVDKKPALRDYLVAKLRRYDVPVVWATDETDAIEICKHQCVAMAMINTSTPTVDPYRLSAAIGQKTAGLKTAVVLLISPPFVYDIEKARSAGVDGYLVKPLASQHLISVLKKFLPCMR